MNDMSSQELQQPQVEPLLDTNRHRRAVEKTLESHSKGLVPERITRTLRMLRQNAAATVLAGLFAVGNANCNNVEQQNTPPPIPPPAVSEYQRPTPPAELTDSRAVQDEKVVTTTPTTEAPTPAASEPSAIPMTEIGLTNESKRSRDETRAIYSQLMDNIETVPKDKRYFVKVGEKGKYQDRALIFTEGFEQDGETVWIVMTRDGPKSFSLKDSFFPSDQLPKDYIEKFIKKSVGDLRQGPNDFVPYETARLGEARGKVWFEVGQLVIKEPDGSTNFMVFRDDPPPLYMVEEAIVKSQEAAGLKTHPPEQLAKEQLERAKSVLETLKPHINPEPSSQPPTPPIQPPR